MDTPRSRISGLLLSAATLLRDPEQVARLAKKREAATGPLRLNLTIIIEEERVGEFGDAFETAFEDLL